MRACERIFFPEGDGKEGDTTFLLYMYFFQIIIIFFFDYYYFFSCLRVLAEWRQYDFVYAGGVFVCFSCIVFHFSYIKYVVLPLLLMVMVDMSGLFPLCGVLRSSSRQQEVAVVRLFIGTLAVLAFAEGRGWPMPSFLSNRTVHSCVSLLPNTTAAATADFCCFAGAGLEVSGATLALPPPPRICPS